MERRTRLYAETFKEDIDARTWIMHRRMISIVQKFVTTGVKAGTKYGPVRPTPLDERIALLGHKIVDRRPVGYICANCVDTWTKNTRHALLENGPCSGDITWDIPASTRDRWIMPRQEKGIVYRGKLIQQRTN